MSDKLPMFPLNTVLFPGVTLPLHVFENRYRALVHHLVSVPDPSDRRLGIVAIREGFEVGEYGVQSVHRVGCAAELTDVVSHPDGRFDITVVGRQRIRVDEMDTSGEYLVGDVVTLEDASPVPPGTAEEGARALAAFHAYRARLSELRSAELRDRDLPRDLTALSYRLAAVCLMPLRERQSLLEAETARERLILLRHALREELRVMTAVPSLPATEVARTGWSPN